MFDWLKWRSEGLGSSDAPAIMGVSPFKTAYQLWEEKTGLVVRDESNYATRRGHELEPKARARYELLYGCEMPVAFLEHHEFPFIRCSLDGYNEGIKRFIEIKCPGKDDIELARQGKVPEKYYPQIQHQFLVTDAESCHYVTYDGYESLIIVEVKPNREYILELAKNLINFWELVQTKTPPPFSDQDSLKIECPDFIKDLQSYGAISAEIKRLEKLQAELKQTICERMTHPLMETEGFKLVRNKRGSTTIYTGRK